MATAVVVVGVDPLVGEPVALGVLAQAHRRRRERRADDLQRRGGGRQQARRGGRGTPRSTVSLRRGSVSTWERNVVGRDDDHLAAGGDPGREVRPLAGHQADLAEEAARPVGGDHGAVGADDVDRRREHDDEVVVVVGRREQHLAGGHRAPLAEGGDDRQLLVGQLREGGGAVEQLGVDRASGMS